MMSDSRQRAVVEQLVRGGLGCTCPDEVFDDIEVTEAAQPFPPGWLIAVGGRLLVYLPRALRLSEDERLAAFAAGRGCRDAAGYRRFRLVETLDGSTADSPPVVERPAPIPRDDRLHWHLLGRERLAALRAWLDAGR